MLTRKEVTLDLLGAQLTGLLASGVRPNDATEHLSPMLFNAELICDALDIRDPKPTVEDLDNPTANLDEVRRWAAEKIAEEQQERERVVERAAPNTGVGAP